MFLPAGYGMTLYDVVNAWTRRDVLLMSVSALLSIILWRIPVVGFIFYPFRLFNTFVHELSHGLAALATGGSFQRVVISPNRFGTAWVRGGIGWVVMSAGYLGSAVFGGILMLLTTSEIPARSVLLWLGIFQMILCLLFVRNLFGMGAGLVLAALFSLAGWKLQEQVATFLLLLLSMQMLLNAFDSLFVQVRLTVRTRAGGLRSDAEVMAEQTRIPALFWALLWWSIATVILVGSVTLAYHNAPLDILGNRSGAILH